MSTGAISGNTQINFTVVRGPETAKNKESLLTQIETALKKNTSFSLVEINNMLENCKNSLSMFEFGNRDYKGPNVEFWSDIVGMTLHFKDPKQPILMLSIQTNPLLFDQIADLPSRQKGIQRVEEVPRRGGVPCFTIYVDLAVCTKGIVIPAQK